MPPLRVLQVSDLHAGTQEEPEVEGDLRTLVSVTAMGILFGGFAVLLAIPFAAVFATLVDVIIRHRNPAEEDVPAVLFPAKEAEEG